MAGPQPARPALAPLLTALCAVLPACFSPGYKNGGLACAIEGDACPEDYYCHERTHTCWRNGTVPPLEDAAPPPPDGGPPDMAEGEVEYDVPPEVEPPDVFDPTARLSALEVTPNALAPAFAPNTNNYTMAVPLFTNALTMTATAEQPDANVTLLRTTKVGRNMGSTMLRPGYELFTIQVDLATGMARSIYSILAHVGGIYTYAKASHVQPQMHFGAAVALAGNTLLVGAPKEKGSGVGPLTTDPIGAAEIGAVFVFRREGTRWSREITLKPPNAQPLMAFGESVAMAGDVAVVGAPGENHEGRIAAGGAAFVFVRGPTGWTQQAILRAADAATDDFFGGSVGITQTTTPTGTTQTTIVVGAPGNNQGAVYSFVPTPAGQLQTWAQALLRPNELGEDNEFGASVAITGDTLVVGAPRQDSGLTGPNPPSGSPPEARNSGAAFIYIRAANGTWPAPHYIKPNANSIEARFGTRVAIAGNLIAVSAPNDGNTAGMMNGPGAVYLYQRNPSGVWTAAPGVTLPIRSAFLRPGDQFGTGLALSPTTLAVGAPGDDLTATGFPSAVTTDSGALYVFRAEEGKWKDVTSNLARMKAPNPDTGDFFGRSVAIDGDTVAVGADGEAAAVTNIDMPATNNDAPGSGAVYLY